MGARPGYRFLIVVTLVVFQEVSRVSLQPCGYSVKEFLAVHLITRAGCQVDFSDGEFVHELRLLAFGVIGLDEVLISS